MTINSFRRVISTDKATQRIQENVGLVFNQVLSKQILDGALVTVSVGAQPVSVAHGLGRQPLGWIIADRQAVASGTEGNIVRTAWDNRLVTLKSTGTGTCELQIWFF